jgi:crossover junction endodeoxyribonuclease RuvC
MPISMGIDPSLAATAVCVYTPIQVWGEVIKSASRGRELRSRMTRYDAIVRKVMSLVDEVQPGEICLEGYSFGSKGNALASLAEFGGLLRQAVCDFGGARGVTPREISPAQVKKFATNKGNAGKIEVAIACVKRWDVAYATDDEYDAYVLARMGACLAGWEEPQTQWQAKVIEGLRPLEAPAGTRKTHEVT